MKLATLRDGTRDGALVVVRRDNAVYVPARDLAPTLQNAVDRWAEVAPRLELLSDRLNQGLVSGLPVEVRKLHAPLPRAYEWVDGSAFLNHVRLVRKARQAEPPATLETDPLVYQGGSGILLGPTDDIFLADPAWGCDFESEVCVILGDVSQGVKAEDAARCVKLLMLANDVSLRNLIPEELAKGFGFFQSKPATAFSPFAVTPEELGKAWRGGRLHLPLRTLHNGRQVGNPDAGEMHFSFFELIQHVAKTRAFTAGTILGSGTVSNADRARGISCLAEQRTLETLDTGKPVTPFMKPGDTVEIEMLDPEGRNLFGRISQRVVGP